MKAHTSFLYMLALFFMLMGIMRGVIGDIDTATAILLYIGALVEIIIGAVIDLRGE